MTSEMRVFVDAVKAHAMANYDRNGWDYIVESYTDEELAKEIAGCKTAAGAIRKMGGIAKLLHEREEDVRSTIW